MSDLDPVQTSSEPSENAIGSSIRRALNVETRELKAAEYVLNEELIDMLENPNMVFTLEREPSKVYNAGHPRENLVYDDPNFDIDATITVGEGEMQKSFQVKTAFSSYERSDLQEPMTKKTVRIDHSVYNSAYFPFKSGRKEELETDKQLELGRLDDFRQLSYSSAFDAVILEKAKEEDVQISFDGYIFSFSKIVHSNGGEHIELEIEQLGRDGISMNKCLRKSNPLEGFGVAEFEKLKSIVDDTVKRAKPRV